MVSPSAALSLSLSLCLSLSLSLSLSSVFLPQQTDRFVMISSASPVTSSEKTNSVFGSSPSNMNIHARGTWAEASSEVGMSREAHQYSAPLSVPPGMRNLSSSEVVPTTKVSIL